MRDRFENGLVVPIWVEAVKFSGANEGEVHTQRMGTLDRVREEVVLACHDEGFDLLLGQVVVYLKAAIIELLAKAVPSGQGIIKTKARFFSSF